MSWFGPKLEPGERLVWRYPEALTGRHWAFVIVVPVALAAAMFAIEFWMGSPENTVFYMINATTSGMLLLVLYSLILMWRLAVTDRRLLVRRPAFWREPRGIPLHEIEDIRMNIAAGHALARGGGQEIVIPLTQEDLPELEQAIERAKEAA